MMATEPSQDGWGFDIMEFMLRYRGPLPTGRRWHIERHIREAFDGQLIDLCQRDPRFRKALAPTLPCGTMKGRAVVFPDQAQPEFFRVSVGGADFVPLVTRNHGLIAKLDIIFLRRDEPGEIVHDGGDLDNRLKTLFDALRIPHSEQEVDAKAALPSQATYCLLEDDSLITRLSIDTQRYLGPLLDGEKDTDVALDIRVTVESGRPRMGNVTF